MESIDLRFGRQFGKSEEEQLFVAYLLAATRAGHLSVGLPLDPHPSELGLEIQPELLEKGAQRLTPSDALEFKNDRWYLGRSYRAEKLVLEGLEALSSPADPLPIEPARAWLERRVESGALLKEQAAAIEASLSSRLTLLAGGPGTGKSYTVGQLIALIRHLAPSLRIAVAAPTGKAVGNLRRALSSYDGVELSTLHTLLKLSSVWDLDRLPPRIEADFIVVDEASMIDIALLSHLLRAVKPGARLLLMGDPDQLPPVEAGAPFGDLVSILPTQKLTRCLRAELQEVVDLADAIRRGDPGPITCLGITKRSEIARYAIENPGVRLLSPLRKGPFGTVQINQEIVRACPERDLPILIARNDRDLGLANGEMGFLVGDLAYIGERKIPRSILPPYEIAYCISIHKSQGSEFDHVAVVVPPEADHLTRQLLYTAATRAKRSVAFLGKEEDVAAAIQNVSRRRSGIGGCF